jgi:transcriptional regulator with XRE-family HTH domain
MSTFQTSILREIAHGKPISLRTRLLYRRRLQNRVQRLLRKVFRDEQQRTGLTQKELAERVDKDKSKVNQWLSIASNLTLETISDLLLGLGVDLDELSVTPMADLIYEADSKTVPFDKTLNSLNNRPESNPPLAQLVLAAKQQEEHPGNASAFFKPASGAAISNTVEVAQQQYNPLDFVNGLAIAGYSKEKTSELNNLRVRMGIRV